MHVGPLSLVRSKYGSTIKRARCCKFRLCKLMTRCVQLRLGFSGRLQRCTNKMFDGCKKTVLAAARSCLARMCCLASFTRSSRWRLFLQRTASWIDEDCSRLFRGVRIHTHRLGLVSCHAHVFRRAMAKTSSFPHYVGVPRAISWPYHRHRPWR